MDNSSFFTVLTLNWNGSEVLPPMVESVARDVERLGGEVLVFDNGSADGSDDQIESLWGDRSWFRIIRSPENLGFAAGANRAMSFITSPVVILANSDTVFLPGAVDALIDAVGRQPEAGIIGPKLLWPDGTLQPSQRDFPFPGKLLRENLPFIKASAAVNNSHLSERRVDWLVGAVMVFRREMFLAAGGFDSSFFFYHEETELQYRLQRQGHSSLFVPDAEVIHVEGASARKMFGNKTYTKYIRAKIKFLGKHGYKGSVTLFRVLMGLLQAYRLTAGFLNRKLRKKDIRYTPSYCQMAFSELYQPNGQENR